MTTLSPTQVRLLDRYESLLRDRAVSLGFVSEADRGILRTRHIGDSLRALDAFYDGDRVAYDLGSGAGLPGLPLAVALPHLRFYLIESRRRRAAFLELAVERLNLENVEVLALRVDEVAARVGEGEFDRADVVTARAFAPLEASWPAAAGLLRRGGRLVYFAGAGLDDPIGRARAAGGGEAAVSLLEEVASSSPLVIMARK
jgi:16S rRNA (guanine527-N7)-methyltransferase